MPVISNGRAMPLRSEARSRVRRSTGGTNIASLKFKTDDKSDFSNISIVTANRYTTDRILQDIALVQEHFGGLSRSQALKICLGVTATAIRKNKAFPEVR